MPSIFCKLKHCPTRCYFGSWLFFSPLESVAEEVCFFFPLIYCLHYVFVVWVFFQAIGFTFNSLGYSNYIRNSLHPVADWEFALTASLGSGLFVKGVMAQGGGLGRWRQLHMPVKKCRLSNVGWHLHEIKVNIWHVVASLAWGLQTFQQQPQISVCCLKIALGNNLDPRRRFSVKINFSMEPSLEGKKKRKREGKNIPRWFISLLLAFFIIYHSFIASLTGCGGTEIKTDSGLLSGGHFTSQLAKRVW